MGKNTDLSLQAEGVKDLIFESGHEKSGPEQSELSASRLKKQLALIKVMAQLSSSGITVYDHHKRAHVYTSRNFYHLFGYDISENQPVIENQIFDSKIHPDDLLEMERNGYLAMKFLLELPAICRKQYKMVNEYRILSDRGDYMRVIEQHQVLELDAAGNIWLSLGVIDISPNQELSGGVSSQVLNFHTGEMVPLLHDAPVSVTLLTAREKEILRMISNGKLSKEISYLLAISVHTVNTHRQRILEKLQVDNSIEAVSRARRWKIIA
ncbi:hypothetical protein DYBT9275_01553 [Dyadobacter sp. CECT 9275]|uniref:HTH luxR-type domain-containing protein n=1 Tax=Dyadobacter helix TaxID=2822344 RepID=A0A916JAS8_9BACT|nr:LuxR C-terminal-related transcriptional regulator [Dyadobacter sp. CECT 9275]CAG4995118.1 hypothetical protein DYBT9275_01553 [Dyadobacter sp. CECT 9275]